MKSWSEEKIGVNSSSYCDNDATSSKMYIGKGRVHFPRPKSTQKLYIICMLSCRLRLIFIIANMYVDTASLCTSNPLWGDISLGESQMRDSMVVIQLIPKHIPLCLSPIFFSVFLFIFSFWAFFCYLSDYHTLKNMVNVVDLEYPYGSKNPMHVSVTSYNVPLLSTCDLVFKLLLVDYEKRNYKYVIL